MFVNYAFPGNEDSSNNEIVSNIAGKAHPFCSDLCQVICDSLDITSATQHTEDMREVPIVFIPSLRYVRNTNGVPDVVKYFIYCTI